MLKGWVAGAGQSFSQLSCPESWMDGEIVTLECVVEKNQWAGTSPCATLIAYNVTFYSELGTTKASVYVHVRST
jgi:hypothetical protein